MLAYQQISIDLGASLVMNFSMLFPNIVSSFGRALNFLLLLSSLFGWNLWGTALKLEAETVATSLRVIPLLCEQDPGRGVMSSEKRYTAWELWVKFHLGQNEDCCLGYSISDSSERLLQSSSGGKSIYKVLVKGEFNTMKYSFYKKVCFVFFFFVVVVVSHEDLISPWRDRVLL